MSAPKEEKKPNPLLTAGLIGVVSVVACVLLFILIQVVREDDGRSHDSSTERTYKIKSEAKLGAVAFVSTDAYYEAEAAMSRKDRAAFSMLVKTKGIRLPAGTPVQLPEGMRHIQDFRDMLEIRVLSGEHKGETAYIKAFEVQ